MLLATVAISLIIGQHLPDRVPVHWDINGSVDGYGSKAMAMWLVPCMAVGIGVLIFSLPALSPKGYKIEPFRPIYDTVATLVIALMCFIQILTLQAGLGTKIDVSRWLVGSILFCLALMGNLLGKVQRNFWMGIRTPWTLSSDKVWIATHRLAARLMFGVGLVGALGVALGFPVKYALIAFVLSALWPVLYSYVIYQKLESTKG